MMPPICFRDARYFDAVMWLEGAIIDTVLVFLSKASSSELERTRRQVCTYVDCQWEKHDPAVVHSNLPLSSVVVFREGAGSLRRPFVDAPEVRL